MIAGGCDSVVGEAPAAGQQAAKTASLQLHAERRKELRGHGNDAEALPGVTPSHRLERGIVEGGQRGKRAGVLLH